MATTGIDSLTSIPPILERAKLAFVVAMRMAFSSSVTDKDLKYSLNEKETKLKIYTAYPKRLEFFPCLVVSASSGDMSFSYLQEDFTFENNNQELYAGRVIFTISLTVFSKSTLERERLIDHLIIFIRHLAIGLTAQYGLTITKDMRIGPETLIEVENEPAYQQVIDIPVYMEYTAQIDQSLLEEIRRINLSIKDFTATES